MGNGLHRFSAEPSGNFKYIFLIQDIFSRKLFATAFEDKNMTSVIEDLKAMFADHGKPSEINADGEFDNRTINQFLSKSNVSVRYKEGRQDLATIDAAMNNYKKMLKKMMQAQNTTAWKNLIPKATQARNRMMHGALMGNADPNEAYDEENKNLAFELREEAGKNGTTRRRGQDQSNILRNRVDFAPILAAETSGAGAIGLNSVKK